MEKRKTKWTTYQKTKRQQNCFAQQLQNKSPMGSGGAVPPLPRDGGGHRAATSLFLDLSFKNGSEQLKDTQTGRECLSVDSLSGPGALSGIPGASQCLHSVGQSAPTTVSLGPPPPLPALLSGLYLMGSRLTGHE